MFAHPGFCVPVAARRQLQATTRRLRQALRPTTPVLSQDQSREVLREGLGAVEAVLTLHCDAKPAATAAGRRVRLEPPLIGELAQMRYVLGYALARDSLDNEPDMNWQQYRAYVHSERVLQLVGAVLRGHRAARANGGIQPVALA